jgi:hypothetical protein
MNKTRYRANLAKGNQSGRVVAPEGLIQTDVNIHAFDFFHTNILENVKNNKEIDEI